MYNRQEPHLVVAASRKRNNGHGVVEQHGIVGDGRHHDAVHRDRQVDFLHHNVWLGIPNEGADELRNLHTLGQDTTGTRISSLVDSQVHAHKRTLRVIIARDLDASRTRAMASLAIWLRTSYSTRRSEFLSVIEPR